MLDYFDAFYVGLTATPSAYTLGFFNQKRGSLRTPMKRWCNDKVNVGTTSNTSVRAGEQGATMFRQ